MRQKEGREVKQTKEAEGETREGKRNGEMGMMRSGPQSMRRCAEGRSNEDDAVAAHKQHWDGASDYLGNLLVCLLVSLCDLRSLLHIAQNHVQMTVIGLLSFINNNGRSTQWRLATMKRKERDSAFM